MAKNEPKEAEDLEPESEIDVDADVEVEVEVDEVEPAAAESESPEGPVKRGRSVKEPPPPKRWRVEGLSPEGVRVILGRFVTREEAEPELDRIKEDGFYDKVRLVEADVSK